MLKYTASPRITPPDGFRYTFPDGVTIRESCQTDWYRRIRQHYEQNAYPMPDNWKDLADEQLCLLLPPGWCQYDDGSNVMSHINTRLEMGDLFRGMDVLMRIAASPDPLVDQATAEARAAACSKCPANISIPGCAPCMKIPDMVVKINGGKTTGSDQFLRSCAVCKCSLQAAVWVKDEVAAHGITPEMHQQFQLLPHCWRKDIQPA